MKKSILLTALILVIISLPAFKKAEAAPYFIGANAVIVEISKEFEGFVVEGLDVDGVTDDKCYINCTDDEAYFIYVDFDTDEITELEFSDFVVGDQITVDIPPVENNCATTSRVQLQTQRY